jgi:hypothetical protein
MLGAAGFGVGQHCESVAGVTYAGSSSNAATFFYTKSYAFPLFR